MLMSKIGSSWIVCDLPGVISVSVLVNNNGEAVAVYKQTPGYEVFEKYEEVGFTFFLNSNALTNHHSVILFYHEAMNYLYLQTTNPDFRFNLYLDWVKAKKELDAVFSVSETQYVSFGEILRFENMFVVFRKRNPYLIL